MQLLKTSKEEQVERKRKLEAQLEVLKKETESSEKMVKVWKGKIIGIVREDQGKETQVVVVEEKGIEKFQKQELE